MFSRNTWFWPLNVAAASLVGFLKRASIRRFLLLDVTSLAAVEESHRRRYRPGLRGPQRGPGLWSPRPRAHHGLLLPFTCRETSVERSLDGEMSKCRCKGESQRRPNNSSLVSKRSQGPSSCSSSRAADNSETPPVSYWIPSRCRTRSVDAWFPGGAAVKNRQRAADVPDAGLIPGSGRPPGGGNGHPLPCSCLENPMDRGAWRAAVHGVSKTPTGLKQRSTHVLTRP